MQKPRQRDARSLQAYIGDDGIIAFANAIEPTPEHPMGAVRELLRLDLSTNQIGDAGLVAFSAAISSRALPVVRDVFLSRNLGLSAGVWKALADRKKG